MDSTIHGVLLVLVGNFQMPPKVRKKTPFEIVEQGKWRGKRGSWVTKGLEKLMLVDREHRFVWPRLLLGTERD